MARFANAEAMKCDFGLRAIRRKRADGYHYFIANLTPRDIVGDVTLAVPFGQATFYNPMSGDIIPAPVYDGKLPLNLRSGESVILYTLSAPSYEVVPIGDSRYSIFNSKDLAEIDLSSHPWALSFIEEYPRVGESFTLDRLQTWESLSDSAAVTMGTGVYTTTFCLTRQQAAKHWLIDLGDVRESARVYLNDKFIGCAWAVPFVLDCRDALKKGQNTLRIEVTNLPANCISDLDRRGVKWRKMNEINVVDINYKKTTYENWAPMLSGLNSYVKLKSY